MKISDSYKIAINNAFRHSVFLKRDEDVVLRTLRTKVHGSANVSIIPPIQGFKMVKIDETHDRVAFEFEDYSFEGIITWKLCANGLNAVFIKIE